LKTDDRKQKTEIEKRKQKGETKSKNLLSAFYLCLPPSVIRLLLPTLIILPIIFKIRNLTNVNSEKGTLKDTKMVNKVDQKHIEKNF
jgi:hypothetical protein